MSDKKWTLLFEILAGNASFTRTLSSSQNSVRKFVGDSKRELASIGRAWNSTMGKIAGIGIGIGMVKVASDSAKLDKMLVRIGQTAGATKDQVSGIRGELFTMAELTGQSITDLAGGFESLVASGLNWDQSLSTIKGINIAMATTGADATTLAKALTTTATAFTEFDLSKPETAAAILDKMTVAGRLGNAELENLSDIFARIGVNAKTAGMSYDSTLAFIESLSMMEKSPERLATLADSTLRLFTNMQYLKRAEKMGFKFFNADGSRRDAYAVLSDIKKKYATLHTEKQQADFLQKMLKGADLDTVKGIRTLMSGNILEGMDKMMAPISSAGGTLGRDMIAATNNTVDQASRLKNLMRDAGDGFARPINKALSNLLQYGFKRKKELDLSSGQTVAVGAAAALTAFLGAKVIKNKIGGIFGDVAGTASGIAEGLALQKATGVAPVYVTNWPAVGFGAGSGGGMMPRSEMPGMPGGRYQEYLPIPGGNSPVPVPGKGGLFRYGGLGAGNGGIVSKGMNMLGPVALAASATLMAEELVSGVVSSLSNGKYDDYADALVDFFTGGKISKGYDAANGTPVKNDIQVNVSVDANGKAITTVTGENTTASTSARRGAFDIFGSGGGQHSSLGF